MPPQTYRTGVLIDEDAHPLSGQWLGLPSGSAAGSAAGRLGRGLSTVAGGGGGEDGSESIIKPGTPLGGGVGNDLLEPSGFVLC